MRFVIRRSSNDQFYFEIQAGNYETLATSETYGEKADAEHAIQLIRDDASSARVVDDS